MGDTFNPDELKAGIEEMPADIFAVIAQAGIDLNRRAAEVVRNWELLKRNTKVMKIKGIELFDMNIVELRQALERLAKLK